MLHPVERTAGLTREGLELAREHGSREMEGPLRALPRRTLDQQGRTLRALGYTLRADMPERSEYAENRQSMRSCVFTAYTAQYVLLVNRSSVQFERTVSGNKKVAGWPWGWPCAPSGCAMSVSVAW